MVTGRDKRKRCGCDLKWRQGRVAWIRVENCEFCLLKLRWWLCICTSSVTIYIQSHNHALAEWFSMKLLYPGLSFIVLCCGVASDNKRGRFRTIFFHFYSSLGCRRPRERIHVSLSRSCARRVHVPLWIYSIWQLHCNITWKLINTHTLNEWSTDIY